uniref:Claudin n=1 Tax=Denticeps clupeoides TaxID=299321 RepID=A0AAY4EGD9_9TELE
MNSALEAAAFLLGFLGWVLVGVALPHRCWKVSTVDGNVITTATIYENLWTSCASDATGVHNCRDFPSLLSLSGYIQACRALMIASLVTGTVGIIATLVGMRCSKAAGNNYVLKGRIAGAGGTCFFLQGKLARFYRLEEVTGSAAPSQTCPSPPRPLHHGRRVLVRVQHRSGVLRPAVPGHQVSRAPRRPRPSPPVLTRPAVLQVRDRRRPVRGLELRHAGPVRWVLSALLLQAGER